MVRMYKRATQYEAHHKGQSGELSKEGPGVQQHVVYAIMVQDSKH